MNIFSQPHSHGLAGGDRWDAFDRQRRWLPIAGMARTSGRPPALHYPTCDGLPCQARKKALREACDRLVVVGGGVGARKKPQRPFP